MHRATSGRQRRSFLFAEFQTSVLEGSKATLDDRHDDHFLPAAVAVKLRNRDQGQHQARVSASPHLHKDVESRILTTHTLCAMIGASE